MFSMCFGWASNDQEPKKSTILLQQLTIPKPPSYLSQQNKDLNSNKLEPQKKLQSTLSLESSKIMSDQIGNPMVENVQNNCPHHRSHHNNHNYGGEYSNSHNDYSGDCYSSSSSHNNYSSSSTMGDTSNYSYSSE